MYVTEAFTTRAFATIAADANTLPITQEAMDDLLALLAEEGSYTYATLKGDVTYETVKLHVESGVLLMDRGQAGTAVVTHPCGTCVSLVSPTTVAAVKSLICEWECCEDENCCAGVESLGHHEPGAVKVGDSYLAHVVFAGTTPIYAAAKNAPDWMDVSITGGLVLLTGTPTEAFEGDVIISACNCNGTAIAIDTVPVTVEE